MTFLRAFFLLLFSSLVLVTGCSKKSAIQQAPAQNPPANSAGPKIEYQEIEWTDLIPKEDLDALMNPPEYLNEIADGSEEDTLEDQLKIQQENPDDPYQKALVSTKVIAEFHQRKVRLPGFIVPLDFDDNQVITTFLLVPFFGACIHVPPPPPNQIIFATYEPGLTLDDLSDAFFIEGTIFTELQEHDLATSAYSMKVDRILPYEE
ncbi:DUF3299 domain-containing protein [Saccharophagus sp. K07]|uniref:DUF3299 domain-containing protein n=1 Tax=Saccharophagus sp. K07 TaxID=2283636 RepID=UPI0016522D96|nr:DUF3299 domain-containing protein [Saccharophagus sp. K07]MBC6906854.1 DUF3299 domain-containing protein [Saccharophagus sp. K07]